MSERYVDRLLLCLVAVGIVAHLSFYARVKDNLSALNLVRSLLSSEDTHIACGRSITDPIAHPNAKYKGQTDSIDYTLPPPASDSLLSISYLLLCGQWDEAQTYIDKAIAQSARGQTKSQILDFYHGILLYRKDNLPGAVASWRFVPGLARYFAGVGSTYLSLNEVETGVKFYYLSESLEPGLQPYRVELYWFQCKEYVTNGIWDHAVRQCEAVNKVATNKEYMKMLGRAYIGSNHFAKAVSIYNQVLEIDKDDGAAYYGRGISYYRMNILPEAESDLSRAVVLLPTDPWARLAFGNALRDMSKLKKARYMYLTVLELGDNTASEAAKQQIQALDENGVEP